MPTAPDQILEFELDVFWQLGPEVLLCKLELDLPERELPVLPVFGDDLIEQHPKGVHVCCLLRLEDHVVLVLQVLDRSIHGLVGVPSDQGQVLAHGVESAAVEDDLPVLVEDVAGAEAAVDHLVFVKLLDGLSQLDGHLQPLRLRQHLFDPAV